MKHSFKKRRGENRGSSGRKKPPRPHKGGSSSSRDEGFRPRRPHDGGGGGEHANKPPGWLADAARETADYLAELQKNRELAAAAKPTSFQLDPWQQEAVDLLQGGASVVVDAPTTAGKTRVVEAFFHANLHTPGFRAAYTTPVKSLSNDKLREFRAVFGEHNVGISTGDVKENLDAPIVVATLESYRNSLLGVEPDLGRALVVFDEYHYLQDSGRGSAWEEAIILTPPRCQLLLLSASVANADAFSAWLSRQEGRNAVLVQTLHRPVPLVHLVYVKGQWILADYLPGSVFKSLDHRSKEHPLRYDELVSRLPSLIQLDLTPVIIYGGRRLACEEIAGRIAAQLSPLSREDSARIGEVLQQVHSECSALSFMRPELRRMIQLYGVSYHHSGLAPAARIAIEALVKQGMLRFCVATMGLSLGINFSVRSALISDYERPSEQGPTSYADSEVLQMLGRAGRRGKDPVGFSLWPNPESYTRMGHAKREPCSSRLKSDPTTFLGLVGRGMSLTQIEHLYEQSFRKFTERNVDLRLIRKSQVETKLQTKELPCQSPAAEFAHYRAGHEQSLCHKSAFREQCHAYLQTRLKTTMTSLQVHLYTIGALRRDDTLTTYGSLARYFPQTGGLLIARMMIEDKVSIDDLPKLAELMGALCMAYFKEPGAPNRYRLPYEEKMIRKSIMDLYPEDLFPDMYDEGRSGEINLREFNPMAGYAVRLWLSGVEWQHLTLEILSDSFSMGDLMGLFYRVGTYLQSISQADVPELGKAAAALRLKLLRTPLDLTL